MREIERRCTWLFTPRCTEVKEIHRGFYLLCVECEIERRCTWLFTPRCTEAKEIHRGFYLLCVECERWRERYINLIKEYL